MSDPEDGRPPHPLRLGPSGRPILSLHIPSRPLDGNAVFVASSNNGAQHVLVLLTQMSAVARCLDYAVSAVSDEDANITAMGVDGGKVASDEATRAQRMAALQAAYVAWTSRSANRDHLRWRAPSFDIEACIRNESAATDFLVIDHSDAEEPSPLLSAALAAGRLTLIAIDRSDRRHPKLRGHIAVAWKPGLHITRAVEAAAPLLRHAEKVTVICVDDEAKTSRLTAASLLDRLRLRGEIDTVTEDGHGVAARLIRQATKIGADCLVMGARGRTGAHDRPLGEVTASVLANTELPLLIM